MVRNSDSDYGIIVAGGKGTRMGATVPKQFLCVGGEPVLMRTLRRFHDYNPRLSLIVVLPHEQQDYWRQLCREHHFDIVHQCVDGGVTRFHSSLSGLSVIPEEADGIVAIHDGVRPFVSEETIGRCFEAARNEEAAIPVMPVVETLRRVESDGQSHNVSRSCYRSVQTPQCFRISLARAAFSQPYREDFTDDASVVEAYGHKVAMVAGNRENIKLTTPFELKVAEALLNR